MVFAGHARTKSRICTLKITHLFSYLPAKNRNGLGSDECCVRGKSSLFNYNVPKYKPKILSYCHIDSTDVIENDYKHNQYNLFVFKCLVKLKHPVSTNYETKKTAIHIF
jgi:hypothetical protein